MKQSEMEAQAKQQKPLIQETPASKDEGANAEQNQIQEITNSPQLLQTVSASGEPLSQVK